MQKPNNSYTLSDLASNVRHFQAIVTKRFEELHQAIIQVGDTLDQQRDAYIDAQVEIHQLEDKIKRLEEEKKELVTRNAELEQRHVEHVRDLDQAVSFLTKRRRHASYGLNSPLSPTNDPHYQEDQPGEG